MTTPDITITKASNVHIRVEAERSIRMGLMEHFSCYVKGYMFNPKYRAGVWDGKIRFLNYQTGLIYAGLIEEVIAYAKENRLSLSVSPEVREMFDATLDVETYLDGLVLSAHGKEIAFRDYQRNAIITSLKQKRRLIQSPTSSGKSSIIYGMVRFLLDEVFESGERCLIVVPTIGLVNQMFNDFTDYSTLNGWSLEGVVTRSTDKKLSAVGKVHITTWQSIFKNPPEWFDSFRCLIVDEAHQAKAASLVGIGTKCNAEFRFGLSGSIDDSDSTTQMTLKGLFGFKLVTTTTKQLMDDETISKATMNCVHLKYGYNTPSRLQYQDEIAWLGQNESRNRFIVDMAQRLEGNVLVLFSLVEKHGKPLRDMMVQYGGKEVFFVYGGTEVDQRELIRQRAETHKGCIILASYQTFATGVSIRNLHHIIFASPTKSYTRVIQSIGRGLRKSETKTSCTIWDLFDEIHGEEKKGILSYNHTFRHFMERVKIYIKQGFDYTINKHVLTEGKGDLERWI